MKFFNPLGALMEGKMPVTDYFVRGMLHLAHLAKEADLSLLPDAHTEEVMKNGLRLDICATEIIRDLEKD